jgi:putative hydrolase of the HAD superfamily
MNEIRLIIFDLDDTLIDTSSCSIPIKLKEALDAMIKAGLSVRSFDEALELLLSINKTASNGKEALKMFLSELGRFDNTLFDVGVRTYYGSVESIKINPLPWAIELLEELSNFFDLALVSMGDTSEQLAKLSSAGISPSLFKSIVFTQQYNKKEQYDMLSTALGYDSSVVLVCGDKFKTDLLPAQELGMKTVWMRNGRGVHEKVFNGKPDFVITSLCELRGVIKSFKKEMKKEL